jgi:hypothetical protein
MIGKGATRNKGRVRVIAGGILGNIRKSINCRIMCRDMEILSLLFALVAVGDSSL